MYYTYIIRCKDDSLYTGITNNIIRRMEEHFTKNKKCAKYTYQHTAVKLEAYWETNSRVDACKLEFFIKKLNKMQKEELININNMSLLQNKIDISNYQRKCNDIMK